MTESSAEISGKFLYPTPRAAFVRVTTDAEFACQSRRVARDFGRGAEGTGFTGISYLPIPSRMIRR